MDNEALKAGKERVRNCLIGPLAARGLRRASGLTVAQHEGQMDALAARLAYMTGDNLAALAEAVVRRAGGKARDRWPTELVICQLARDLQEPPLSDSKLVVTYLRSDAGRRARDEGYLPELLEYLKKMGCAPNAFALGQLRDQGARNRTDRRRALEDQGAGRASPEQLRWLHWYEAQEARAVSIMTAPGPASAEGEAA